MWPGSKGIGPFIMAKAKFSIPEKAILDTLPAFAQYSYSLGDPRYPWELPGVQVPQAPPYETNCCTFIEAVLVRAFAEENPGFGWSRDLHNKMMILDDKNPYSPINAACEAGMGEEIEDPDVPPLPWTLVQGWRNYRIGGHTFIIVDRHEATDRCLILEANKGYGLNGVGFRMIGMLAHYHRPPDCWWSRTELWTWERVRRTYRYGARAALNVTGRYWSGL
jgi:hypothetical protein